MTLYLFIAVVILNIPVYVMLYRSFFGGFWSSSGDRDYITRQFAKSQRGLYLVAIGTWTVACYFMVAKFVFGFADPWAFLR